jgi:hypothetical protein
MFQQTCQKISQSDSDSTENHFSVEIETLLFLSKSKTVPSASLRNLVATQQFLPRPTVHDPYRLQLKQHMYL